MSAVQFRIENHYLCLWFEDQSEGPDSGDGLVRRMGLFDSTMMMAGIVIGSSIFLTTGIMAKSLPSSGFVLLAWVVGGLLVIAGALTFGELGASFPRAGGQYGYLGEAYGPLSGFLFGWILLLVSMGGAIAAAAVGFATYLGTFFPALSMQHILLSVELLIGTYTLAAGQLVGVLGIVLLSSVNYVGAGPGKTVQNIISVIKIATLIGFIVLGLTLGRSGHAGSITSTASTASPGIGQILIGFGVALIAVSWTFDGWHNINYVAGEITYQRRKRCGIHENRRIAGTHRPGLRLLQRVRIVWQSAAAVRRGQVGFGLGRDLEHLRPEPGGQTFSARRQVDLFLIREGGRGHRH